MAELYDNKIDPRLKYTDCPKCGKPTPFIYSYAKELDGGEEDVHACLRCGHEWPLED